MEFGRHPLDGCFSRLDVYGFSYPVIYPIDNRNITTLVVGFLLSVFSTKSCHRKKKNTVRDFLVSRLTPNDSGEMSLPDLSQVWTVTTVDWWWKKSGEEFTTVLDI